MNSSARPGSIKVSQPPFDVEASLQRCRNFRRRILDVSQRVTALHIAPAFSCLDIVDFIYHGPMRQGSGEETSDSFVLSKGHGCMAQYVVLESLGILEPHDLDMFCTVDGKLGGHPDRGLPGIEASTGSLGHGLGMAVGMAYANRLMNSSGDVYVVLSDGEVQEGSVWEAVLMAPVLGVNSLVAFIDNNDFQSLGRTSTTHPNLYPMDKKFQAFGWDSVEVDGHDAAALDAAVRGRTRQAPLAIVCKTIKGKGVSFMENVPLWHYRSPNEDEYHQAIKELGKP